MSECLLESLARVHEAAKGEREPNWAKVRWRAIQVSRHDAAKDPGALADELESLAAVCVRWAAEIRAGQKREAA